jgi:hypothetical protein
MIDFIITNKLGEGYFTVNGNRGTSCDSVLDLFLRGTKASATALPILTKWKAEADEAAARCEAAWERFANDNPELDYI